MKGRVPISQHPSAASTWVPLDAKDLKVTKPNPADPANPNNRIDVEPHLGVPRPDKSSVTLAWLSGLPFTGLLGIDHFYLRSPGTGFLKFLSIFLAPGLWYLWDIAQQFNEWDRVKLYGLSAPFDMIRGIGQGMFYTGPSNSYVQTNSFGLWVVATVLGIFGFDSIFFRDNLWLGFRKFMITVLILTFVLPCIIHPEQATFFALIGLIFILPDATGLLVSWLTDLKNIFGNDIAGVFKTGLPMPKVAYEAFSYNKLYENEPGDLDRNSDEGKELTLLEQKFMFDKNGLTPAELKRMFWIRHSNESAESSASDVGPPGNPIFLILKRLIYIPAVWIGNIFRIIYYCFNPPAAPLAIVSEIARVKAQAELDELNYNLKRSRPQEGGAHPEELSTEAQILGATVVALIAGGSLKGLVDYLMTP